MKLWKILVWIINIPLRLLFWPILWLDLRRRRLRVLRDGVDLNQALKEDKWHPLDRYLISVGHVVKTFGYWPWEEKAKICWPCIVAWINAGLVVHTLRDYLYALL